LNLSQITVVPLRTMAQLISSPSDLRQMAVMRL